MLEVTENQVTFSFWIHNQEFVFSLFEFVNGLFCLLNLSLNSWKFDIRGHWHSDCRSFTIYLETDWCIVPFIFNALLSKYNTKTRYDIETWIIYYLEEKKTMSWYNYDSVLEMNSLLNFNCTSEVFHISMNIPIIHYMNSTVVF